MLLSLKSMHFRDLIFGLSLIQLASILLLLSSIYQDTVNGEKQEIYFRSSGLT